MVMFSFLHIPLFLTLLAFLSSRFLIAFQVLEKLDHDPACFTQGLLYHGKYLYESCGLNRESMVKKIDYSTGKVIAKRVLDDEIFAEGNVMFNLLKTFVFKHTNLLLFSVLQI